MPRHWVPWSLTRAIQALAWPLATCQLFHLDIQSTNWPCISMCYWWALMPEDSEMHHAYTMTEGIRYPRVSHWPCVNTSRISQWTLVTESQTLIVAVNATISGCKTLSSRSWRVNTWAIEFNSGETVFRGKNLFVDPPWLRVSLTSAVPSLPEQKPTGLPPTETPLKPLEIFDTGTHQARPAAIRGLFPTRRTWHRNWWQCYERWRSLELWPWSHRMAHWWLCQLQSPSAHGGCSQLRMCKNVIQFFWVPEMGVSWDFAWYPQPDQYQMWLAQLTA